MKKTNLNSIKDLRDTTELELNSVFTQLGYDEQFWLTDLKIAAGYGTVVLAGLMYWIEKNLNFKNVYWINAGLIALYFVLSALMWFFSNLSYKNIKYIGKDKNGNKITVKGWIQNYDPYYYVQVKVEPAKGNVKQGGVSKLSFEKFFDGMGFINQSALVELVQGEVKKISE